MTAQKVSVLHLASASFHTHTQTQTHTHTPKQGNGPPLTCLFQRHECRGLDEVLVQERPEVLRVLGEVREDERVLRSLEAVLLELVLLPDVVQDVVTSLGDDLHVLRCLGDASFQSCGFWKHAYEYVLREQGRHRLRHVRVWFLWRKSHSVPQGARKMLESTHWSWIGLNLVSGHFSTEVQSPSPKRAACLRLTPAVGKQAIVNSHLWI